MTSSPLSFFYTGFPSWFKVRSRWQGGGLGGLGGQGGLEGQRGQGGLGGQGGLEGQRGQGGLGGQGGDQEEAEKRQKGNIQEILFLKTSTCRGCRTAVL